MADVISMKIYKYQRYEMDMPKKRALNLATLNEFQVKLCHERDKEKGLKRLLQDTLNTGGVE